MTTYYAIVEGDALTSGGNSQVIEGNRNCTIDDREGRSRAQTYLGHKAWCAACQSIGVIAAGAGISDHLRGIDYTIGGAQEAVDGDIVICNCAIHPRLIAVYARCCEYVDTGPEALANSAAREAVSPTQTYDEQFTLRDANGSILPDTYYTIRFPNGELIHGTTNNAGCTARCATDGAQHVAVYLGHKQEE